MIPVNFFEELFEQSFDGNGFLYSLVVFLYIFFFEFCVLENLVRQDLEACDLPKANDTASEGLVELLWDQLGNDLFTRTFNFVLFVK